VDLDHAFYLRLDVEHSPQLLESLEAFLETLESQGLICSPMGPMDDPDAGADVERSRLQIELILLSLNPSSEKRRARASL